MRLKLVLLPLVVALSACASAASAPISLDSTSWVVTKIKGNPTLSDHQPTLEFSGARVSGSASCNRFTGGFTQNGTGVSFSPLAVTQMACSPDQVMAQETAFTSAMATVAKLSSTAEAAELQNAAGDVLLTLAKAAPKQPAKPLEGTEWELTTITSGEASSSVVAGTSVTRRIEAGKLSGRACNSFSAAVSVDGTKLRLDALRSTKMACPSPAESKQEAAFIKILQSVQTAQIEGASLHLSSPDGSGLDFAAK